MAAEPAAKERARRARRGAYRQLVLEAAERSFAARGYDGTKMQDVAAEAGIALGTLYGIIEGKEELYGAIHAERGRGLLERAAARASAARSPFDALRRGVEAYVHYLLEHPHYLRLHLEESQPWALEPRFTTDIQRRQWSEGLAMVVAVFEAGIADGTFVEDVPERMARLMIAAHQVYLADWMRGGMVELAGDVVARMVAHAERQFCARMPTSR